MKLEKVLLIDDDDISNHISRNAIFKVGFSEELVVKTDGRQALEYIRKECLLFNVFPELILLDLKMPGMDGFDFLKEFEIISRKIRRHIVVVILTSSRNADDIMRLRNIGNYHLLNKPLTPEKIIDIYHRYFRNRSIYQ